jgi:DNA-binding transcriptional LysR family regulator
VQVQRGLKARREGWLGIELRHFAALEAVAAEASFHRAASKLDYTQSAISQQIASLERAVGQRLIERPGGPQPVRPTEAGQVLLRHIKAINDRLSAAQADLDSLAFGSFGRLRVGTYQSVGAHLLPKIVRWFATGWPRIEVQLTESVADPFLFQSLEQGELDLAFVVLPPEPGPFKFVHLMSDPYVLLVQAGSPLASRKRRVGLRELAGLPLVCFKHCRSRDEVISFLRTQGVKPQIVFQSDDNATVCGFVAAGFGVGLLPSLAIDQAAGDLELVQLDTALPPRRIGIAWQRDRDQSAAAAAFVKLAREVCADLQKELTEARSKSA